MAAALAGILLLAMKPPGAFKISSRQRAFDAYVDSAVQQTHRTQRILESLRNEILEGGDGANLRIRRIFQNPREIYRLELQLPELGYHRTTLLDRDALEELLAAEDVRAIVRRSNLNT